MAPWMHRWTPPWIALPARIAGAALCGLLLALAFAPHDWWWTLPVAVAGLTACCRGLRPPAGFVVGMVFGLCFILLLMPWLRVIGSDAWVALSVLEAVFYGLLGAVLTLVVRLPLEEWSLKISADWSEDPPEDIAGPAWAGMVPLVTTYGEPLDAPDLAPGIEVPASVRSLR